MPSLDQFFAEHRRLHTCTAEMADIARTLEAPPMDVLNETRWRFSRTLLRTLTMKDRLIYPRLRLHPDRAARATAERFSEETVPGFEAFLEHTRRFPPAVVASHWRAYAAAVRLRTTRMQERMIDEERELFPLLDGAPAIAPVALDQVRNWAAEGWRLRELYGMDAPRHHAA